MTSCPEAVYSCCNITVLTEKALEYDTYSNHQIDKTNNQYLHSNPIYPSFIHIYS